MCSVFEDKKRKFFKLIIQPEITNGGEEIEITLTKEQAEKIKILENISFNRE